VDAPPRVIVVEGVGTEPAANDRCIVTVALRITREHAADALQELAALANKVVATLHEAGIERGAIATHNVTVQDWYDQQGQRVAGQQATYQLAITVSSLDEAGPLLQRLSTVARNALQIVAVATVPSDTEAPRTAARARAVADAQARATQLAGAAGVRLGPLVSIEESAIPWPRPLGAAPVARTLAASAPLPVEGGSQDVTVRVTLTFGIED
jgi:uncharacterized protein YggE